MKKKVIAIIISCITLIVCGIAVLIIIIQKMPDEEYYKIEEVRNITSPNGITFRIEYKHDYFPNTEYFAYIYVEGREKTVGFVKLLSMYSQKNTEYPDPQLIELVDDDDIKCYVFFDSIIVFNHNGEYGFIHFGEMSDVSYYINERFIPVAERLCSKEGIDPIIKDRCAEFLDKCNEYYSTRKCCQGDGFPDNLMEIG